MDKVQKPTFYFKLKKKGKSYMNKKIISLILIFFSFVCILSGCKKNKEPDKTDLQIKQEEIYNLAKESGFNGTYEEWLETIKGVDGTSIVEVKINSKGELIITLSDGKTHNLGVVKGSDGKDGLGIKDATINTKGELIVSFTDGTTKNLGVIKGSNGTNGVDGIDGIGISDITIDEEGYLIVKLSDGTTKNLGLVGKPGKPDIEGVVPVYQGMTLESQEEVLTYNLRSKNRYFENGFRESIDDFLDIITTEKVEYYADKGETFNVVVHIYNPSSYEILSFTLNGYKYQAYEFKEGSNSTRLIIEVNAGLVSGLKEYTIDAIKYIDGTEIKDVQMDGEKTVKAGVRYEIVPTASVLQEEVSTTSYKAVVEIKDDSKLMDQNTGMHFFVFDGQNIVSHKALKLGINHIEINDLLMGTNYEFMVVGVYDDYSGKGKQAANLIQNTITTLDGYLIESSSSTQDEISVNLQHVDENATIKTVELLLNNQQVAIQDYSEIVTFKNLLSNTEYQVKVTYSYLKDEVERTNDVTLNIKTEAKQVPNISLNKLSSTKTSVEYGLEASDIDNVKTNLVVTLYNGNIKAAESNELETIFENLYSNNEYKLVVKYSYDLNDGTGTHELELEETINTKPLSVPTVNLSYSSLNDQIDYSTVIKDNDNTLEEVIYTLYKGTSLIEKTEEAEYVFTKLLSNTEYKLVVTYTYNLNDNLESIIEELTYNISTLKDIPTINLSVSNITSNSVNVISSLNDKNNVGRIVSVGLYLNNVLVTEELDVNNVKFENLTSNTNYKVIVKAQYDLNDGSGSQQISKEISFTSLMKKPVVSIDVTSTKKTVNYQVIYTDENKVFNLEKVEILKDGVTVKENNELSAIFDELQSSTNYLVKVTYSFEINDGLGKQTVELTSNIKTKDLTVPSVGMNVIASTDKSITTKVVTSDTDNILTIKEVNVYQANNLVHTFTASEIDYELLLNTAPNTEYKYVISYEYDLNNGLGIQESTYEYSVISSKEMPVINLTSYFVTQHEMEYNLMISDPNASGRVNMISLYQGSSFIERLDETTTKVENLNSNTTYTIKVNYVYDFNDGLGSREINYTYNFTTLKQEPIFDIYESNVTKHSLEIEYDINDIDGALSLVKLELFLDEELIKTYHNLTDTLFEELLSNNEYKLVATFNKNINTGDETHTRVIYMSTVALEKPSVEITLDSTKTTIDYSYLINDPDKISTLKAIDLYYQGNKLDIQSADNQYSNLYTNSEYELVITLLNDYQDGRSAKEETYSKKIYTDSHVIPSLNLGLTSTAETINYQINLADPNNLIRVNKINVYKGLDLVKEVTDFANLTIEELESNTLYTLEVEYEYNLNDNLGYIKQTYTIEYSTLAHNVTVIGYELINNLNPKTNEDINIKVLLENKSQVKMDYLVVNGNKVQIAGGDYYNNVIFYITAPKVSGEFTITVDKMGYFLNGVEVEQLVETEVEININIMSRLDIISLSTFDGTSVYKNSNGLGFVIEIDNPNGYEILEYGIAHGHWSDSVHFVPVKMIDDNHAFLHFEHITTSYCSVRSVKYIDENGAETVRNYQDNIILNTVFLDGEEGTNALVIHQISTPEELMNLESGKSYELINDIDMSGYNWVPYNFDGYFDGKGHKISNLSYIEETEYAHSYFGLFKTLRGVFKNIYFENLYVNVSTSTSGYLTTYILYSDYNSNAIIENVMFTGNFNATYDKNGLNSVSVPSGNNIYAVGSFKLNNEDYPNLEKITKETFESEEFRLNTLNWNFKEKELGNYEGLLYTVIGNSYIIINGYEGDSSELIIPETINDLPVVGVADLAFENNKIITSITYPDTLLSIGSATLKGCINLESLTLEEAGAVKGYNVLTTLFSGIECDGTYIADFGELKASIPNVFKNLTYGSENEEVNMLCVNVRTLEKVEITGNIKIIPFWAFENCTGLKEIILPNGLEKIGESAFYNCDSLVKVEIPDTVTVIGNNAFSDCENLETVVLSKNLKEIGSSAFDSSMNLKYFTLPNGLEKIGRAAFNNVYQPEYIYIPESVKVIGGWGFNHVKVCCYADAKPAGWAIDWNQNNDVIWGVKHIFEDENFRYAIVSDEAIVINNLSTDVNIVIPENIEVEGITYPVVKIANRIFMSNEGIKSLTIKNDIEIDEYAFAYCTNLESVQIDGDAKIGDYTFYQCSSLKTFSAKSITYIGDFAFQDCRKLVSISSLEQATYLGRNAFEQCNRLESVVLPDNITEIKRGTFISCSSLKYIIIPKGVTTIEDEAFYGCNSLKEIILPSTLEYIGRYVFTGCMNINSLVIPKNVEYIGSSGMLSGISIFCEAESQPDVWEYDWSIGDVVAWGSNGKFVKDDIVYLFEVNNEELTVVYYIGNEEEVIIPDEVEFNGTKYPVTRISNCFRDNQTITSLTLSNNITYLPDYAFSGMFSLKTIKLPSELDEIGSCAFYGCQSLEEIDIPSKTKRIHSNAFDLCPKLVKVYIPISVESIGYAAFDTFSREVYCEAASKPELWDSYWNSFQENITWGYVKTK